LRRAGRCWARRTETPGYTLQMLSYSFQFPELLEGEYDFWLDEWFLKVQARLPRMKILNWDKSVFCCIQTRRRIITHQIFPLVSTWPYAEISIESQKAVYNQLMHVPAALIDFETSEPRKSHSLALGVNARGKQRKPVRPYPFACPSGSSTCTAPPPTSSRALKASLVHCCKLQHFWCATNSYVASICCRGLDDWIDEINRAQAAQ